RERDVLPAACLLGGLQENSQTRLQAIRGVDRLRQRKYVNGFRRSGFLLVRRGQHRASVGRLVGGNRRSESNLQDVGGRRRFTGWRDHFVRMYAAWRQNTVSAIPMGVTRLTTTCHGEEE